MTSNFTLAPVRSLSALMHVEGIVHVCAVRVACFVNAVVVLQVEPSLPVSVALREVLRFDGDVVSWCVIFIVSDWMDCSALSPLAAKLVSVTVFVLLFP